MFAADSELRKPYSKRLAKAPKMAVLTRRAAALALLVTCVAAGPPALDLGRTGKAPAWPAFVAAYSVIV